MGLNATTFMGLFRTNRILCLIGRYGSGKTALTTQIAIHALENGWVKSALGNYPSVVFDDPNKVEFGDAIICMDEAGVWLSDKEFDKLTAFLRKKNLYVVMGTVLPPPTRAKVMTAQRVFNWGIFGAPVWSYAGALRQGEIKENCNFTWVNPSQVFGLYSTGYVTDDDCGLLDWVKDGFDADREARRVGGWLRYKKRDNASVPTGQGLDGVEESRGIANAFTEAASTIANAVSVANGKGRRGRN